jgi:magnesium chelatase family protein
LELPTGSNEGSIINPSKNGYNGPILDHIRGQDLAKRAIEIAIAGHHNILISGPPGAGKTLLAKAAINLLPDLTSQEMVEITKLYSIAGLTSDEIVQNRPFRSPHHSASMTSLIGGATGPGEISLAHKGILFLDEIPEFPRSVLEALRQPLEDREITISRAGRKTTYPADFMLVATMNPCPCGYLGDETHECKCTESQIQNYQKKLSGPLFDRIDMCIEVQKVNNEDLRKELPKTDKEHNVVKNTITEAIARQRVRFRRDGVYNSSLSSFEVAQQLKLEAPAEKLLASASERLQLSARSYFKTIKVAQTIADIDHSNMIKQRHIAEALTYRRR